MASGILGVGLTGLYAAQAGIQTTEHNISNANTAGYRRQEVSFYASKPQYTVGAYFGTGVSIDSVRRQYSQFLDSEVLVNQAQLSRHQTYVARGSQVDALLGDGGSGLSTALDKFFGAVDSVANEPTSNAARQTMLSAARNLVGRVNTLGDKLQSQLAAGNREIDTIAAQVTTYAQRLATLNDDISRAEALNGQPANDLRDQRDQVLTELNKLVNVTTTQQSDGSVNVFIGSGQALVTGGTAGRMGTALDPADTSLRVPTLIMGNTTLSLDTRTIHGGQLGGLLSEREEIVLPALRDIGRIAIGLAEAFNALHAAGYALDGTTTGLNFFSTGASMLRQPLANSNNTGNGQIAATLTSVGQLTSSEYLLSYDGSNYTLTRLSDGQASAAGPIGSVTTINGVPQGFTLSLSSGTPNAGDTWSIRLTQDGAKLFALDPAMNDPSRIAAASQINSPGDNANALALANMRFANVLSNGTATFNQAYNQTIGRTASLVSEAGLSESAFSTLVTQSEAAQKSVSGVNLDEEAVNLIRFQQAYQASAKAIQVASSLFGELLDVVR